VLLRAVVLSVLSLVLAACQPSSSAPTPASSGGGGGKDKLTVAYIALNATQMPSWVAKEQGIFDKNGLDVDLQYISSGQSPTAALISGGTQVMVLGEQVVQADIQGADLVYIAAPTSTIFFSLYARPDNTNAEQLRGKKLGITQAGSSSDTAAKMALRSLKLEPGQDVTILNVGSAPNILAGMQSGAVDAGMLSSPTNLQARAAGMRELVNVAKLDGPVPSGWAATSKRYVNDHQDTIRKYVRSIAEAVAFEINNPEPSRQILAKYVQINDPNVAKEAFDEVVPYLKKNPAPDPRAVRAALDELSASVPQAKSADPASFIDTRFTDELESSGFIKSLYPQG
jgi:ABC-type nitrate/sulfonate/bicarbonate transport system substrate-binding protein